MSKIAAVVSAVIVWSSVHTASIHAEGRPPTLAVIMTNDAEANAIQVYDTGTTELLQTLPTMGKGGAGGNANGVSQHHGELVAAVNYGSSTVAVYRQERGRLRFETLVYTTSKPVSVDFANDHMYVAGTSTVDSFAIRGHHVDRLDGTALLVLADGAPVPEGSTAQVGAVDGDRLLVTLKADPAPGTIDVVTLHDGAIAQTVPLAVSAPDASLTPFGFAVYPDGSALVTLAHSDQNALFRDGQFTAVTAAGQSAPCWMTIAGKYVFVANTASRTLSRLVGTGSQVVVDATVAAAVPTGNPVDLDAADGVLAVLDHGAGTSHLSVFTYNAFGELTNSGVPVDLGVPDANGVALISATDQDVD
jgi:hypothetical protein